MMKSNLLSILLSAAMLISLTACSEKTGENDNGGSEETKSPGIQEQALDLSNLVGKESLDNTVEAIITVKDFGSIKVSLYADAAPLAAERFTKNAESGYFEGKGFHRIMQDFMVQAGSYDGTGATNPDEEIFEVERNFNARHYYGSICVATNLFGENGSQFYIVTSKDTETFEKEKASLDDYKTDLVSIEESFALLQGWMENPADAEKEGYSADDVEYNYKKFLNLLKQYTAKIEMIENVTEEIEKKYAEIGGTAFLDGGYTVMGMVTDGFDVLDAIAAVPVHKNSQGEESAPDDDVIIEKVEIIK